MVELLRLTRPGNLGLAAAGVLAGGWLGLRALDTPAALAWAALSGAALGAAGNIVNDLWDLPADRVNRPERPLPAGRVSPRAARAAGVGASLLGLAAAGVVSAEQLALAAAALVVMAAYSPLLKSRGIVGNVAVAVVAALPLPYGALAVGRLSGGGGAWLPFGIAAAIHLIREIMKDIADMPGDRRLGRRTLPLVVGFEGARRIVWALTVLFLPLSLAPLLAGYDSTYAPLALAADATLVAAAIRLQARLAKVAMGIGLVALVVGGAL